MSQLDTAAISDRTPEQKIASASAAYVPFPAFSRWSKLVIENSRWNQYAIELDEQKDTATEEQLERAQTYIKQLAAVETGALEGLYEIDRGFTITAATEVAAFAAALEAKDERAKGYIESQLRGYAYVLDFATRTVPVAEAWIRELHQVICGSGATYRVQTATGEQVQQLPLGQYKSQPNHVELPDGALHAYAPPLETAAEMARLVEELRAEAFLAAHPVLQAAFAHYALVWIHPFADGNGRVARALASVYTYRALSLPLLITTEQKRSYLKALRAADNGGLQHFVDFIFQRSIDTIRVLNQTLRTARLPELDEMSAQVRGLYRTSGGYSHTDVDEAAYRLAATFAQIMQDRVDAAKIPLAERHVQIIQEDYTVRLRSTRLPRASGGRIIRVVLRTKPPADLEIRRDYQVEVPQDASVSEAVAVVGLERQEFEIPIESLLDGHTLTTEIQTRIVVDRLLGEMLSEFLDRGNDRKRQHGY
jgi:Fic family protein